MKNKIIKKPAQVDGMLYQKTNEDFNREMPSKADPIQTKANPVQEEKNVKPFKKNIKK